MKTILATAYAINPYRGSEDGMGWNFVKQIARFNRVIAVTRVNNKEAIEKYMYQFPDAIYSNIEFFYFDLPYWMRFWKKGSRGAMLYYLMWQFGIVSFIKKNKLVFDIAHNLNFHNDWTPSFLWRLKKPFVWGSVGHHPLIPVQYLAPYKFSYWVKDRLTWMLKQYFWNFSISLYITKKKASHILCMNSSAPQKLRLAGNYSLMPSIATQDFGWNDKPTNEDNFIVISAGRFVPLKGFDLTIEAFANFLKQLPIDEKANCQLVLVGSGPEEKKIKKLIKQKKLTGNTKIISWIDRDKLMEKFKKASTFLFPSHEGAGMVVAEALSFGLPIICLDNEGPGEFINKECGFAIPKGSYKNTVVGLSYALETLYTDKEKTNRLRRAARTQFENAFNWDRRGEQLQKIYNAL